MERFFGYLAAGLIAVTLAGCGSPPVRTELPTAPTPATPAPSTSPMPAPLAGDVGLPNTPRSRWLPARWEELPGWQEDPLHEAWEALLRNCERPGAMFAKHCPDVRRLSIADGAQQRAWLMARFQPYRLESAEGQANGLLTSYYEPIFDASRARRPGFETPL
jgi:membrane-bound lytic murein transglycosylase A